jgi:phosphate transport system ATP-binding protein
MEPLMDHAVLALEPCSRRATAPPDAAPFAAAPPRNDAQRAESIKIKDLSIHYGRQQVVDRLTLTLPAQSITALIGPSGCGKSSVLGSMNRLTDLVPNCRVTGEIHFSWLDNDRLAQEPMLLRRHVGMLFQRPNPFPFSIWRNLAFALEQHGVRNRGELAARIEAALQEVGLWAEVNQRLNAPALALSGGQQQRLCLARALVLDPSVLLMDEPCSALDPLSTQTIETLMLRLAERRTIVLVTHSLAQARRVASRVALLWQIDGTGRLVEQGPTEEVFNQPQHALTRSYLQFG